MPLYVLFVLFLNKIEMEKVFLMILIVFHSLSEVLRALRH